MRATSPSTAGAQSLLPDGVTFTGHAQVETLRSSGGETDTFGYLDFDLTYRAPRGDSGGVGFALGFTGITDFDNLESNFYAALLFGLGPGEIAIGRPRLAFDMLMSFPSFAYSELLNIELSMGQPNFLSAASIFGDLDLYGLTYSARYGDMDVAASVVRDFGEEVTAAQIAAAREIGDTRIFGGAEWARGDGENLYGVALGATTRVDAWSFGGQAVWRSGSGDRIYMVRGFADYELRQPRRPQPREIVARVVGRPRERRRRDHQEALAVGGLLVGRELLGRDEAVHRVVLGRRLQVLADGQEIDARRAHVVHHLQHLPAASSPRPTMMPDLVNIAGSSSFTRCSSRSEWKYRAPGRTSG
jgi:hypothetical protein